MLIFHTEYVHYFYTPTVFFIKQTSQSPVNLIVRNCGIVLVLRLVNQKLTQRDINQNIRTFKLNLTNALNHNLGKRYL